MTRTPPSDAELAAIVAAVELVWPSLRSGTQPGQERAEGLNWRWSGRWWGPSGNEVASSRRRPWS